MAGRMTNVLHTLPPVNVVLPAIFINIKEIQMMGKFKKIDQLCKKGDKDGLIAFLAEHGIQNPHKQANIYIEEYKMNRTVKISDINKEIADEMQLEKKKPILDTILELMSERISNLIEISEVLSERITMLNKRINNLEEK